MYGNYTLTYSLPKRVYILKPITITKSHQLVTAHLEFTAKETDIFHLLLTSLKKETNAQKIANDIKKIPRCKNNDGVFIDKLTLTYEYTREELLECLNVTPKYLSTYLDEATSKIMKKVAIIRDVKKGNWCKNTLVNTANYVDGVLTLQLNRDIAELLLNYTKGFAIVDFNLMFSLKTTNEKRILDLISRFKNEPRFFRARISEVCNILGVDFKSYASFGSFRATVLAAPLKKIVGNSKGMWVFAKGCKTGIKIDSSGRAADENSFVEFRVDYVDLSKAEITKLKTEVLEDTDDLLELSEVVAAWRKGIAPTKDQAMDISMEIGELTERDLLTMADFKKLRKAIPPID